jgi:hypothetical protein
MTMTLAALAAHAVDIDIDGDAHTVSAPAGLYDGRLASFSELGIAALALPGGAGRLARRFGLTTDEVVAASNGRVTHSAVPVGRVVVAVGLAYALEHASGACRGARAFAASAPAGVTVKTFLQTLPAIEEIPEELHGRRVLAVAAVYEGPPEEGETILAPLRAYGEPLLDLSARVPHEVVRGLRDLEPAILS